MAQANVGSWPASAQLAYRLAIQQGATPAQATDFAAVQYGESGFNPNARNRSSGAAGLYQLLSPGYVNRANELGGVYDPQANIQAILPDYLSYYRSHPTLVPGAAGAAVERSGEGAGYYAQGYQHLGGSAPVAAALTGSGPYQGVLGDQWKVIGTPYSGTHTLGNWESDNAVDLSAPVGTPVYAALAGKIGNQFGSLGEGGRFAGLRLHLDAPGNELYYAHLSKFAPGIQPGAAVTQGQLLGYSGAANGVGHLHFGAETGDPRALIGSGFTPQTSVSPTQVSPQPVSRQIPKVVLQVLQQLRA